MRAVRRQLVGTHNDLPSSGRDSGGSATSFNTKRFCIANEIVRNPSAIYVGFSISAIEEEDYPNSVTYHTSIEYPQGIVHEFTTNNGTSVSLTVPAGSTGTETDPIKGLTIPKGAQFWIIAHGSVSTPGELWYRSEYASSETITARYSQGTPSVSDFTLTPGSIPSGGSAMAMCPALIGDVIPGTRNVAIIGDSISIGAGGYQSTFLSQGYLAGYCEPRFSYCHFGRIATKASDFKNNMTKRLAFMANCGFTDVWQENGVNDLSAIPTTPEMTSADIASIFSQINEACPTVLRYWQSAITPRVTLSDGGPTGAGNQTVITGFASSKRQVFNNQVRSLAITGQTGYVEAAVPCESLGNDGLWKDNYSDDGTHPNQTGGSGIVAGLVSDNALSI